MEFMERRLKERECQGNARSLRTREGLIDLCSNDYLGLARSSVLQERLVAHSEQRRAVGSTGSRLLSGQCSAFTALEEQVAGFHGYEAALIFNSGYVANLGLLSALGQVETSFLYDTHVHASTHDGLRLARSAQAVAWRHNDLNSLETKLRLHGGRQPCFVCVESIYATDGSIAPLAEISALCERHGAQLIVDEAHATGVIGPQGSGLIAALGLGERIFAQVVTFSKALGTFGAAVLGSHVLKNYLINFCRPFIYTTALPPSVVDSIRCSYALFPEMESARQHLQHLIRRVGRTGSPLQPIVLPGNARVKAAAEKLEQWGFDVRPLMSPTVPRGRECLRVVLHAFNTEAEIDQLQELLCGL